MAEPEFGPEAYGDSYREVLELVIEAKLTGQGVIAEPAASGEHGPGDRRDARAGRQHQRARKGAKKTATQKSTKSTVEGA